MGKEEVIFCYTQLFDAAHLIVSQWVTADLGHFTSVPRYYVSSGPAGLVALKSWGNPFQYLVPPASADWYWNGHSPPRRFKE